MVKIYKKSSEREENPKLLSRRQALARLGGAALLVYVAPSLTMLSGAAHASSGSQPSVATPPTPPTPPPEPTLPSTVSGPVERDERDERDERSTDRCLSGRAGSGSPIISPSDYRRAQESVDAGYAKPLRQIWPGIVDEYTGDIVGVRFTGFRYRPRYRLKAVSTTGRLETVIVSARTGDIIRIVGC